VSGTDKTQPWRVNTMDPLNSRLKMVGNMMWSNDGTSEHFFKRMGDVRGCWCCSQKRHYANEQRSERGKRRRECRTLAKGGWHDET